MGTAAPSSNEWSLNLELMKSCQYLEQRVGVQILSMHFHIKLICFGVIQVVYSFGLTGKENRGCTLMSQSRTDGQGKSVV